MSSIVAICGGRTTFKLNGEPASCEVAHHTTLADMLRASFGLTGTHLGCEQGICGACTVLVDGTAIRSCLMLAAQVEGRDVVTVEGVSGGEGRMHPVQSALAESRAMQCGFCIPGIVMSAVELAERGRVRPGELEDVLAGHICRCTGYESIRTALETVLRPESDESSGR